MERVDDAPPERVRRDRRGGNEERSCDGWIARLCVVRHRLAEQQTESWSGGTKLGCRRHREVELERVGKQEHPVGGRTALEVGKVHRIELVDEPARPVTKHLSYRHVVGNAEAEVHVGETVAAVDGERAHGGAGHHALVLLREP